MIWLTDKIKGIRQDTYGFINPNCFFKQKVINKTKDKTLHRISKENVAPSLIGLVVDSLTRFLITKNKKEVFSYSILGSKICALMFKNDIYISTAQQLLDEINGLDDNSIISACNLLVYYDYFRDGEECSPIEIKPNKETIHNIKVMVQRNLSFFEVFETKEIKTDLTFESDFVLKGSLIDGYYMTNDTLWDFKLSVHKFNKFDTWQLAIFWMLGIRSVEKQNYLKIKNLGFFNPRLNTKYILSIDEIDLSTFTRMEKWANWVLNNEYFNKKELNKDE